MLPEDNPDIVSAHDDGERDPRPSRWAALAGHRRIKVAAVVVLAAVVAIVAAVVPRHQAAAGVTQPGVTNFRSTGVFNTFAAGLTDGQEWQLTVQNVATDGHSCLPAVVWTGEYGDRLFPGTDLSLTPAGAPSVISGVPEAPTASFAFFQVPAAVRQLQVVIGTAAPLTVTPRSESECGRTFRLAGFGFASAARVTVTAITGHGRPAGYTLPYALVHPSRDAPGYGGWQNQGQSQSQGWGTPELIGRAVVGGVLWGMTVADGTHGECFSLTKNAHLLVSDPLCAVLAPTGANTPVEVMTAPAGNADGYAMAVIPGVTLVTARLPGGRTAQASPVDVGGVLYVGLLTSATPIEFSFYGPDGTVIAAISWSGFQAP
jgi:hypothetical protein